ncbi:hypothetical protein G9A89_012875 [Geosiphon pyriformis]|nr:hypothetical protein G9A89_012875 [Geosiphon pyriformis]
MRKSAFKPYLSLNHENNYNANTSGKIKVMAPRVTIKTNPPKILQERNLYNNKESQENRENQVKQIKKGLVWPPHIEKVFLEAMVIFPATGGRKHDLPTGKAFGRSKEGKALGRNQLISDFIYEKTGLRRTPKQVSSHIQVHKQSNFTEQAENINQENDENAYLNNTNDLKPTVKSVKLPRKFIPNNADDSPKHEIINGHAELLKEEIYFQRYYEDDKYQYTHVCLPDKLLWLLPIGFFINIPGQRRVFRLLSVKEWRDVIGVQNLDDNWEHCSAYTHDPHVIVLRKKKVTIQLNERNSDEEGNTKRVFTEEETDVAVVLAQLGLSPVIFKRKNSS